MPALVELSVSAFDAEVASDSPAPGGGSAAALAGSVGAGLIVMVCRLSLGREDVEASDAELTKALHVGERLRRRLLELVDEDTEAFNSIMDAIRMPKEDDSQRSARKTALGKAKLGAADPPLETLAAARETVELAASLAGRTNEATASDLGVAVELARAAAEGALLNVAINLSTLPVDGGVEQRRRESQADIEAARISAAVAAATVARGLGLSEVIPLSRT
jgi:methenyltetrahydrofolate cyclohydrolase